MYADDTTIYLTWDDSYSNLEDLLQNWCKASGAKFNLEKTEILPIGTTEHQQCMIQTRKMNDKDNPWQEQICIAQDEHATSWEPTGKKLIVQMVAGGMMQFLTKAQGMPKSIENTITKQIRDFIWNEKRTPPISSKRLEKLITEGGLDLLNIKTRNEAINIMWLKTYMDISTHHPTWTFIIDAMINSLKPDNPTKTTDPRAFLTS
ncbi:hypothetical protein BDR05DRAFT_978883 [Suillus weaverae]|nr:hypothetical protein BDR05DRAFT_978883 [Suillus weaverae]